MGETRQAGGRPREFGVIGLGRMGGGLAQQALEKGFRVVGYARNPASADLRAAGLNEVQSVEGFRAALAERPRLVFLYVPAGPIVDHLLDLLADKALEPGDVIADGGNSYWGDSIRRHDRLKSGPGLRFVDLGTSGGVEGARRGACFMAGGEVDAVTLIAPICRALAVPGGWVHAGPAGAGHYAKLVHNGVEFGMLEAIAEGFDLLRRWRDPGPIDVAGTLQCWRHGSVVRSWLVDLLAEAYSADPRLEQPTPYIEDTGEVNWLVMDALQLEAPVPAIAQAVMQLFASRDTERDWARAIVLMRRAFGAHPLGPDEGVARERREGRVGDLRRPSASPYPTRAAQREVAR
jgi:6-phosphogluconate dehydrogenase